MSNSNSTKNLDELVAQEKRRHRDKLKRLRDAQKAEHQRVTDKAVMLWSKDEPGAYEMYMQRAREVLAAESAERAARARKSGAREGTSVLPDGSTEETFSGGDLGAPTGLGDARRVEHSTTPWSSSYGGMQ